MEPVIAKISEHMKTPPNVKIVHHGLKELISCPNCKVELDKYVADNAKVVEKVVEKIVEPPQLDVRVKGTASGLFR